MADMRVFITGISGTLGGYIARELVAGGHAVTGYSRRPFAGTQHNHIQGDVCDFDSLAASLPGHDAVIHLAAIPGPGRATPESLIAVNTQGTANVLEAAVRAGVPKVVFASSAAALGFTFARAALQPLYFPIDEEHPAAPQDPYGLSKLLGEVLCKSYSEAYGVSTLCLRVNNAWYVDREGAEVVVQSGWAKGISVEELWTRRYVRMLEDSSNDWPVPGPVSPRKNLWAVTDARDIGAMFRLAVEDQTLKHEVFLVNSSDTCSPMMTPELLSRHYPEVPVRAPLEGYASLVSCRKAESLLGFRPRFTWRQSDFAEWYRTRCASPSGQPQARNTIRR